ncbi:hypothetical protein RR46_14253 [Papilio xuthus]|nr:hypothetical protein RR46_14253 [Papilio xuthus]
MLTLLHNDMEDDAERRGFYEVAYGNQLRFHEGDVISTNNQRRFAKAQDLASVTVKILYTSTIMTSIYLLCSIMLLHGAVNYKKEYILPWTLVALINLLLLIFAISIGEGHPSVIDLFNGHTMYHFTSSLLLASFMYAIATVISFSYEISSMQCAQQFADERGERLLLLDHAAHSSLLSAAQLNKLSNGTRTHFV